MFNTVSYWVDKLALQPHEEGGYFKQTYASHETITVENGGTRHLSTSILFLLTATNPSHFHRLTSDEIWYFHTGHSLTVHMIHPDGTYETVTLGTNDNDVLQFTVPKGVIFGSSVDAVVTDTTDTINVPYALVSCSVTPGFDYADFELFTKEELLSIYPQHHAIIDRLSRSNENKSAL